MTRSNGDDSDVLADVQEQTDLNLRPSEAAQLAERRPVPAMLVFEVVREAGEEELERSPTALLFSGLAAGLSISFCVVAQGAVHAFTAADLPGRALLEALAYSVGFLIVILARQQLFTENTLTVIAPLVARPGPVRAMQVARLWSLVLASNFTGCFLFALAAHATPMFSSDLLKGMQVVSDKAIGEEGYLGDRGLVPLPKAQIARVRADIKAQKVFAP